MWVAGNVTDLAAQVGTSTTAGAAAAAQINADLVAEETRQAIAAHPDPFSPRSEARFCELVLGDVATACEPQQGTVVSEEFGKAYWEERYRGP